MVRRPPETVALSGWYHCSSSLRTKPDSKPQLEGSGAPSLSNSSDQASFHFDATGARFTHCSGPAPPASAPPPSTGVAPVSTVAPSIPGCARASVAGAASPGLASCAFASGAAVDASKGAAPCDDAAPSGASSDGPVAPPEPEPHPARQAALQRKTVTRVDAIDASFRLPTTTIPPRATRVRSGAYDEGAARQPLAGTPAPWIFQVGCALRAVGPPAAGPLSGGPSGCRPACGGTSFRCALRAVGPPADLVQVCPSGCRRGLRRDLGRLSRRLRRARATPRRRATCNPVPS